jgi:hypothetical protein
LQGENEPYPFAIKEQHRSKDRQQTYGEHNSYIVIDMNKGPSDYCTGNGHRCERAGRKPSIYITGEQNTNNADRGRPKQDVYYKIRKGTVIFKKKITTNLN